MEKLQWYDLGWTFFLLLLLLSMFLITLLKTWQRKKLKYDKLRGNLKSVPVVTGNGWLPFIGHGLVYAWDMNGFLRRCEEEYGKIFSVQFFSSNFTIMTDREFVNEFMAAGEEEMSFFTIFQRMYFFDIYACDKLSFQDMVRVVIRNGVAANWTGIQDLKSKIGHEATDLFQRLTPVPGKSVDFGEEMRVFVASSNARIFLGVPLSSQCFMDLMKFFKLFNTVIMLSFFLPKPVIRFFLHKRLCTLRDAAAAGFFPEIQKYRQDPGKTDSYTLRTLVDHTEPAPLSDVEIGRIITIFLHIATENTAIAFSSVVADCLQNPEVWKRYREEVEKYCDPSPNGQDHQKLDIEGLLGSDYLQAVILESARLNAEAIQVSRKPGPGASVKGYYVGDADTVAIAPGLLHVYGRSAQKLFKEPEIFNPDRFLKSKSIAGEQWGPTAIVTWGAGVHYCPGKSLALAELKIALSVVLLALKREELQFTIRKGFLSPGFFTDKKVTALLRAVK